MTIKVGIINANSDKLCEFIHDEINQGTDIIYEEFLDDLEQQGISEEEIERQCDNYRNDHVVILFGDAWVKVNGRYEIDRTKEFAATYNNDSNVIAVEWSKYTRNCAGTSPCYVMADGSGRCGDLDTDGETETAYDLPPDFYCQCQ
jgi:hypothetical protein